jgi:hypothetical protein
MNGPLTEEEMRQALFGICELPILAADIHKQALPVIARGGLTQLPKFHRPRLLT